MPGPTRRALITGAAAASAIAASPFPSVAQSDPIKLGVLTPLTGAGGQDGPRMLKAMEAVIAEVNKAGGVLGRKLETVVEDDQTNPEAAVRAARKLIEVNKVPVIMGTWASAVTSAVAPVCWEAKTFLCTVSGADSITQLPHQGYLIRTQPNSKLQATAHADFIAGLGKKKVAVIGVQAPFALSTKEHLDAVLKTKGAKVVAHIIYEKDKATYRSEIDQAMRSDPDFLYLNGYAPDTVVVLRDLYKANINLPKFCQSYAVPQKTLDTIPAEVSAGTYTGQPSADIEGKAFKLAAARLGIAEPDSYEAQATDWASLVILTLAKAKEVTGTALKENVRKISQGSGEKVWSAVEGLQALAAGKEINYEGASGPCDFTEIGDIEGCRFRYMEVVDGKLRFLKVV
ncbi:MAG TPA: ABC transporter substrate-binding protein [Hyphomicrobiaceae bacterium]|jgi:branched-chain amino acid transport system substrate-binding protein|nr:ABC transporter substrate-binding protein [Hyphomicrobiaceae bacterium]